MGGSLKRILAVLLGASVAVVTAPTFAAPSRASMSVLYRFSGGADGGGPMGSLIADKAGNLYGMAAVGGGSNVGVVFELSPSGSSWTETVLHSFSGPDGANPAPGLALDAQGNLYGMTYSGSADHSGGVVFELTPAGGGKWTYSLLGSFGSPVSSLGANPNGSPVFDAQGNLYGGTLYGGSAVCPTFGTPCGTVFELSPAPQRDGSWSESVVHSFGGAPDGSFPYAPLVFDKDGNLFGTTNLGGIGACMAGWGAVVGCGTVFEMTPSQSGWTQTQLYNFKTPKTGTPLWPVTVGTKGVLYGASGDEIYRLTSPKGGQGAWKKDTLLAFSGGHTGTTPSSGVSVDRQGNLYGTTSRSGHEGFGTAFELSPPGSKGDAWTETTLATFAKGAGPQGGLLVGADGALYGAVGSGKGYIFAITR